MFRLTLPGFKEVHYRQTAVQVGKSQLVLVVFCLDAEEVEVGDVVEGLQGEGGLQLLDGLVVFVELGEEESVVGVENGHFGVVFDEFS